MLILCITSVSFLLGAAIISGTKLVSTKKRMF